MLRMAKKKSAVKKLQKPKAKVKAKPRAKKARRQTARRQTQIDVLDQLLLNLAAKPYDKILKQIESGRKRLDEERRIALEVGSRILSKAKKVRDSLISSG